VTFFAALFVLFGTTSALAHIGPPYPIMQNRKIGPLKVDVWSNPDVGIGSFFVIIDPPPGGSVPADMKVQVIVQPVSKRLPEAAYNAWREKLRDRVEFKADVPFDKQEMWKIRILLTSAQATGETDTEVPVTPSLMGRLDLLLFLLPFLAVGFLWFKAIRTNRKRRKRPKTKTVPSAL
jgi:hypothetical protein